MKRSEMVKRLATYMYDCNEARASDTLQFLEDQGMMPRDYVWDLEEEPKVTIEEQIKNLVAKHMNWDTHYVDQWWYHQPNPLLGGLTPNDMVSQGRHDKLIKWIKSQIDENNTMDNFMEENKDLMQDLAKQEEQDKRIYENEMSPGVLSSMTIVQPDTFSCLNQNIPMVVCDIPGSHTHVYEVPKLSQKGAVKRITAEAKARRKATQAKFKRHRR